MSYEYKREPLDPCPVELVLAMVAGKWKARILLLLWLEAHSFAELQKALPGVKQQVLATQLRGMMKDGIVRRDHGADERGTYSVYGLTEDGRSLMPVLETVAAWGERKLEAQGQSWNRPEAAGTSTRRKRAGLSAVEISSRAGKG